MLATALVPAASADGATSWSGGLDSWKVVLHTEANSNEYAQLAVHLYRNGSEVTDLEGIAQDAGWNATYTSNSKNADGSQKNAGSWGFGDDGYGPFNSFYAAFDPSNSNRMVCHLNPNNLKESVDGKTTVSIDGKDVEISDCNIMWCLPTVWWGTDNGDLVMTNVKTDGMEAYAHTIDDTTYPYLAIGVYEASSKEVGGQTILTSESGGTLLVDKTREVFRDYANNQKVDTTGDGSDGCAMLWNFYQYELYKYCTLAVMGGWDSQSIAGNGSVYGYGAKVPGLLDGSGPYAGTIGGLGYCNDPVKVFVENAWGSVHDFVDGIVFIDKEYYISQAAVPSDVYADSGNYSSANPPSGYSKIEGVKLPDQGVLITSISTKAQVWGMPTVTNGLGTRGFYDNNWAWDGVRSLFVGGCTHSYSPMAYMYGLLDVDASRLLNNPESYIGGRLAFVFDTDPTASVKYDHSQLESLLKEYGYPLDLMSNIEKEPTVPGKYDQLKDVGEFRHVGWIIDAVECPATSTFLRNSSHTAKSVWVGLPAVTYDHSVLVDVSGDRHSVEGLSNGLEIKNHDRYEQLPDRDGFAHAGWRIEIEGQDDVEVGPTAKFVTRQSHTAVSLWVEIQTVTFDHSGLTDIVGTNAKGVSELETSMVIQGDSKYPQLPNTAGYRHVGWVIDGEQVGPTAGLVSQETHDAKSVWEKIPIIPIIPDADDDADVIEVIVPEDSESWIDKNGRNVLLAAIVMAIIAELAVLCISRKR